MPRVIAYRDLKGVQPVAATVKARTVRKKASTKKATVTAAPSTSTTMRVLRGTEDSTVNVQRDGRTADIKRDSGTPPAQAKTDSTTTLRYKPAPN